MDYSEELNEFEYLMALIKHYLKFKKIRVRPFLQIGSITGIIIDSSSHNPSFMSLPMISSMNSLFSSSSSLKTKRSSVSIILLVLLLLAMIDVNLATHRYYSTSADNELTSDLIDDYSGNIAKLLTVNRKRSCLRRGASCDHRPDDCCDSSVCRCNVWGTNCRCQRAGLFQRWG